MSTSGQQLLAEWEADPKSPVLVLSGSLSLEEVRSELGVMVAGMSSERIFSVFISGKP